MSTTLQLAPHTDNEREPLAGAPSLAEELNAINQRIRNQRGPADAAYLYRLIRIQRRLDLIGRLTLGVAGWVPVLWPVGTASLAVAKILENMEIGHNVMHGQWDWLGDPDILGQHWEWDNVCDADQWRHSHNEVHHQWTNVYGKDHDIGYGIIRVTKDQDWEPRHRLQPLWALMLALGFEWGVGAHDFELSHPTDAVTVPKREPDKFRAFVAKVRRQLVKDYVAWPAVALIGGPSSAISMATGAFAANLVRNIWAFSVIFCGHFPGDVSNFTEDEVEGETLDQWYRRQILGSANFSGGKLMSIMAGNLNYQIEHHLFPDLPSNRYAEIAPEVQEICVRHGLAYNTASLPKQLMSVASKIWRLRTP